MSIYCLSKLFFLLPGPHHHFQGRFSSMDQYPDPPTERILCCTLSQCPRNKVCVCVFVLHGIHSISIVKQLSHLSTCLNSRHVSKTLSASTCEYSADSSRIYSACMSYMHFLNCYIPRPLFVCYFIINIIVIMKY